MKEVSALIARNPNILSDAIPIFLVDTIQKFDATLLSTLIEKMREMDPKPWSEWTEDDVPRFLDLKETREYEPYPVMKHEASLCKIDCVNCCDY